MRRPTSNSQERATMANTARTALGISMITGAIVIAAPFLFGYTEFEDAMWSDVITGAVIVAAALLAASLTARRDRGPVRLLSMVIAAAGVWLIAAPHVLDYTAVDEAFWVDTIAGIVVVLTGLWSTVAARDAERSLGSVREEEYPEQRRTM